MTAVHASTPDVTVVIPTRNRARQIGECLQSLRAQSLTNFEVLVMDQSDDDGTEGQVEVLADGRVRFIRVPRRGANPARNLGAARAAAPIIAFLDDDCSAPGDWLAQIADAFDSDPDLQFIFGQLKAPPHDTTLGSVPEFLPEASWQRRRGKRRVAMVAAGANMAARKSFLLKIGGFDELLGPTVPDISDCSISFKVLRSGAKWVASPEIEVIHTSGFREHAQLANVYQSYGRELGLTYGRFVRRGDPYALWCFAAEQAEMGIGCLRALARTGHPRGAKTMVAHARGFVCGLRLPGELGHVTGGQLRKMARSRTLTP